MMKTLLLSLLFVSLSAQAQQLYRCEQNGGIVYSEKPCGSNARLKQLNTEAPDQDTVDAAKKRARNNRIEGYYVDQKNEADYQRRQAALEKDAQARRDHKKRCEKYKRDEANAKRDKELYVTERFRNYEEQKAKEAADAQFTECFGSSAPR